MTNKIFRNIFLVSILTFVACYVVIMGVLYGYFEKQIKVELKNETIFIAQGVQKSGDEYFVDFDSTSRVTWINSDGSIIYDTDADESEMNNHADRKEFKEAIKTGHGEAVRYSQTLSERTIYCAKLMEDGSVIRVSTKQNSILALFMGMVQPMLFVFVVAIALSAFLASKLSKRITKPINELNLDNPKLEQGYEEIAPLVVKINRQNKMIALQMNELSKKQKEFSQITDNMNEGFIVIDMRTDILSYNNAALRLLGHDIKEMPKTIYELNRSEELREAVENALDGKSCVRMLCKNERYYQIIANSVTDSDSKVSGVILVIMDITEKEEREKLRREFTSNVSHELKTPLTSIFGMSEMIMLGMVKEDDVRSFGGKIYEETKRLVSLVNDILKISQLDEGHITEESEQVDLYDLAKKVIERLKDMSDAKKLSVQLSGEHVCVNGVYSIIEEMIYNLMDNAIKYNNDNGNIDVNILYEGKSGSISIKDTGIGIPEADKDRVFERFYRVDKSHTKKIGGTGLGLSIVKHAAAYHNARISMNSSQGIGTTIKVTF